MTLDLQRHHHIHFVGIAGIGMSALARLLQIQGFRISGSDRDVDPANAALTHAGISVIEGHAAEHLGDADLVVISAAVPAANPEVLAARARSIPVIKRAELLAAIANAGEGIAVAGTHGKTTTTALLGHVLVEAGLDPTVLVGGITTNWGSNARPGKSSLIVVEADEYDASFLHLRPSISVITNVEPDHLDFYGSIGAMQRAFHTYAEQVRDLLVICADDPVLPSLVGDCGTPMMTYGMSAGDWRATEVEEGTASIHFTVEHDDKRLRVESPLLGEHNVRNALAAMATAHSLGVRLEQSAAALLTFSGVQRHGERKGEEDGVLVMDDYGHHPSEVRTTLAGLRRRYQRPLRVIFQPHTYSRTHALLDEFSQSFGDAESVYLLDIYASRETDTLGISGRDLAAATARHHQSVHYTETAAETVRSLVEDARPGDLVVTMGAGDVTLLGPQILAALALR